MWCRAIPCIALRCGAVPCCCRAVLSFEHTVPGIMRSTRYQVPECTCVLVFLPFSVIVLVLGPLRAVIFRKIHPYCRSECDIANKHTAQHRANSSTHVALGIITSLVAPNHGPLLSALSKFTRNLPCASVAGGVSSPRSEALAPTNIDTLESHARTTAHATTAVTAATCKKGNSSRSVVWPYLWPLPQPA